MLVLISDTLEESAGDRTLLDDVCRSTNRTVFPYHSIFKGRLSPRVDDISGS